MNTGIFFRGIILGLTDEPYTNVDKQTGEVKNGVAHLVGIQRDFIGTFGEHRSITQKLRIPEELFNNTSFMSAVHSSLGAMVEIPLTGYQDYPDRRFFISKDASIHVCGTNSTSPVLESGSKF